MPAVEVMRTSPLHLRPDLQGRFLRHQGNHEEVARLRHAEPRPVVVRPLRGGPDQLRGRAAQRRLPERPPLKIKLPAKEAKNRNVYRPAAATWNLDTERIRGAPPGHARTRVTGSPASPPTRRRPAAVRVVGRAPFRGRRRATPWPAWPDHTHPHGDQLHQTSRVLEIASSNDSFSSSPTSSCASTRRRPRCAATVPGRRRSRVRQARRDDRRGRAGRAVRNQARGSPTGTNPGIFSWDYLLGCDTSRMRCGSATCRSSPRRAPATREPGPRTNDGQDAFRLRRVDPSTKAGRVRGMFGSVASR